MHSKNILLFAGVGVMSITALTGCKKNTKEDEYTSDGRLKITIRNLYFDDYRGGDFYLREKEKDWGVKINFQSYSWANWSTQVTSQVIQGKLPDVFHANIDSYNYANTYKYWADENVTKPLPEDMSRWPHLQEMLENTSNIDSLKIKGRLYGIPVAKNTTDYSTSYSPFTYIYRRDWAKKFDQKNQKVNPETGEYLYEEDGVTPIYKEGYTPIYQENDEYTWEQFEHLLEVFKSELAPSNRYALADVEWGFPSIINFYKQVPHCYAFDSTKGDHGKYVNNYLTEEYMKGLDKAKEFMSKGWYYPSQNEASDGDINELYCANKIGVFYENLSYSNYQDMKKLLRTNNVTTDNFNIDDAMAIMKIHGPAESDYAAGKYALEGTDNWFSMTFFDKKISNKKMEKVLDILDWLLSEEGTTFAIYGFEDDDYVVNHNWFNPETGQVEDHIEIIESAWPKAADGTRARKNNGAKYLRYMVSLGYDTLSYDPMTDQSSYTYLNSWEQEMKEAYNNDQMYVLKEAKEVMWLTGEYKSQYSGLVRENALTTVMNYVYGSAGITSKSAYRAEFDYPWSEILSEINRKLGYN